MVKDDISTMEEIDKLIDIDFEILELRMDYYIDYLDMDKILHLIKEIKNKIDRKIIFTLRTKLEGGNLSLEDEEYFTVNKKILDSGLVEFLDIEFSKKISEIERIIEIANKTNTKIILSKHIFNKKLSRDEILTIFEDMENFKPDLVKLAIDIGSEYYLDELILASIELKRNYSLNYILIGMGEMGKISRIIGESLGSYLTFVAFEETTAKGQIDILSYDKLTRKIY